MWKPGIEKPFINVKSFHQWGAWTARSSGAAISTEGCLVGLGSAQSTVTAVSDDTGVGYQQNSAASIDSQCRLSFSVDYAFKEFEYSYRFMLKHVSDIRFFAGWQDSSGATSMILNDDASFHWGVHFSPADRSDTNFMFTTNDGTNPQVLVDSGVAPAVDVPYVIYCKFVDGEYIEQEIWDAMDEKLLGRHVETTDVPTNQTVAEPTFGLAARAAAVKSIVQYKGDYRFLARN